MSFNVGDVVSIHDANDYKIYKGEATILAVDGDTITIEAVEGMQPGDVFCLVPPWLIEARKTFFLPYFNTAD